MSDESKKGFWNGFFTAIMDKKNSESWVVWGSVVASVATVAVDRSTGGGMTSFMNDVVNMVLPHFTWPGLLEGTAATYGLPRMISKGIKAKFE